MSQRGPARPPTMATTTHHILVLRILFQLFLNNEKFDGSYTALHHPQHRFGTSTNRSSFPIRSAPIFYGDDSITAPQLMDLVFLSFIILGTEAVRQDAGDR